MVDVGAKAVTKRMAVARGEVRMSGEAFRALQGGTIEKGEAVAVAKAAGILAAKRVDELIPLCHSLPLDSVKIDFNFWEDGRTVGIESCVNTCAKTGVEMEALTAVSIASLTLYDMCKALDKGIVIQNIRLIKKTGGKSGTCI
jgi:cyclic pyranopterin phosphate synthase